MGAHTERTRFVRARRRVQWRPSSSSSGSYRVQVRRKGQYASKTFLRKSDADDWAVQAARDIDNGKKPAPRVRAATQDTFGNLIDMHLDDLADTGKPLRRSKAAVLRRL
jgi:hypothetical protein